MSPGPDLIDPHVIRKRSPLRLFCVLAFGSALAFGLDHQNTQQRHEREQQGPARAFAFELIDAAQRTVKRNNSENCTKE